MKKIAVRLPAWTRSNPPPTLPSPFKNVGGKVEILMKAFLVLRCFKIIFILSGRVLDRMLDNKNNTVTYKLLIPFI